MPKAFEYEKRRACGFLMTWARLNVLFAAIRPILWSDISKMVNLWKLSRARHVTKKAGGFEGCFPE